MLIASIKYLKFAQPFYELIFNKISHRLGDGAARAEMAHEQSELLLSEDWTISRSENGHPGVRCQQPRPDYSDNDSHYTAVQNRRGETTKRTAVSSRDNQRAFRYAFVIFLENSFEYHKIRIKNIISAEVTYFRSQN